jgi:hypothetical protein
MNGALSQRLKSSCPDLTGLLHDPSCNLGVVRFRLLVPHRQRVLALGLSSAASSRIRSAIASSATGYPTPLQRKVERHELALGIPGGEGCFRGVEFQQRVISLPSSSAVFTALPAPSDVVST